MTSDVVGLQLASYRTLDELCSALDAADWHRPTDCPGWSVKDHLSHVVGTESMLLGRPPPDHAVGDVPWVRNEIGRANEVQVDYRRPWPPERVLAEFREVTAERAAVLRALTAADLEADSWTPVGPGKLRDLLAIRVMDCWVHEQDIRRATGRPGGLGGDVARHVFSRHATALPFVVGKKVAPPEGTTVVFDVEGMGRVAVEMRSPRAVAVEVPERPTVRLRMDMETFNRLCCGRGDVAEVGRGVAIEGDADLGRRVVAVMPFMV